MQRLAEADSAGELKCRTVVSDRRTHIVNLYIRYKICFQPIQRIFDEKMGTN